MDLTPHVDELRQQLMVAAEAGGDDARALAERLVAPLGSATRLVLLDALAAAADEITSDLAPGSVEVRLRGRDPEFVVTAPPTAEAEAAEDEADAGAAPEPVPPTVADAGDEGGTARVTLRLPEPLKARIEDAAGAAGLSVNAWLVRAVAAAAEARGPGGPGRPPPRRRGPAGGRSYTGWAR